MCGVESGPDLCTTWPQRGCAAVYTKRSFSKPADFQKVIDQIVGDFHQPESPADLPVNLEAYYSEDQDRQEAKKKCQDDLATDLKGGLLQGSVLGKGSYDDAYTVIISI